VRQERNVRTASVKKESRASTASVKQNCIGTGANQTGAAAALTTIERDNSIAVGTGDSRQREADDALLAQEIHDAQYAREVDGAQRRPGQQKLDTFAVFNRHAKRATQLRMAIARGRFKSKAEDQE
jgi:hypothetical protein